jgi:AraC-like DNA-binding protein
MQARLREGGQPFKTLVDEVRRQLAALYLRRDDVSLVDVGFLLGFSEQSAFSRAFRRWYGMAPQQYQKSPR